MRGVSEIIGEILLIIITIVIISTSFYFYHTTIYKSGEKIEERSEKVYCSQSSNIVILEVDGSNVTIKNKGGTKLNLDKFRVYVNGENRTISTIEEEEGSEPKILELGETATIILQNSILIDDKIRVIGGCDTGDEIIVE